MSLRVNIHSSRFRTAIFDQMSHFNFLSFGYFNVQEWHDNPFLKLQLLYGENPNEQHW
jgi:hypothetical protein